MMLRHRILRVLQRDRPQRSPSHQDPRQQCRTWQLDDRFHETSRHGTGDSFVDSSFAVIRTRSDIMARWRQAVELAMTDEEIGKLAAIARSRSEAARRVERAQILLAYREKPSFFGVGQRLGRHHQTVQRCVERDGLWPAECILISARAATRPNFTSRSQVLTI